jgi:NADH:ubiquinone oxidoreductase subunit 3 (subunit A)
MIEYIGVLVYFLVATLLGVLMFWAATKCSPKRFDLEKVTAYECGYDAFGEARSPFDVGFYLVAILFLVFDIEVAYLIPWALGGVVSGWAGLTALLLFLAVLVIGFVYEWGKGALDWNSPFIMEKYSLFFFLFGQKTNCFLCVFIKATFFLFFKF